jgi:hypothetical protein
LHKGFTAFVSALDSRWSHHDDVSFPGQFHFAIVIERRHVSKDLPCVVTGWDYDLNSFQWREDAF